MRPGLGTIALLLAALLSASSAFPQGQALTDELTGETLRLTEVYGLVEQYHADPVDPDRLILEGGIRGLLSSLDPFSAFFNADQFEALQQQARGEALGFGSILYVQPGKVVVLQTAEGSPSWRAGLGPGDEIVGVNGTRLDRLDFNSMIELLQKARSGTAHLAVIHPGHLVAQDFELRPAPVALPTVDKAFLWRPGIGYLHVTGFELKTASEVADAIQRLGGSSLQGLLLDLRDNHGGIVDAAIATISLFLKPDLPVLTVKGRDGTPGGTAKTYRTISSPVRFEFPLIVLTNENTASAAEVMAAAVEEHDRAVMAGEPTFGKGVVETVLGLSEKTGLALTTAQYFTPSGRSIQRPIPGTALAAVASAGGSDSGAPARTYYTDNGRPVTASGGVTPDVEIHARRLDPWGTFLNQRGLFTSFASQYLSLHPKPGAEFSPDRTVMNDFEEFLTQQQIRTPEESWSADQDYLKLRIRAEIANLSRGLTFGDEIDVRGDPQVQKAAALFPRVPELLKPRATPVGRK